MPTETDDVPFDIDALVGWCVGTIATGADYAAYDTAFWRVADVLLSPPAAGNLRDDPDLRRRLARCVVRTIWRQAPHPAHRYAAAPLPATERNAPCHCGSGRKYKQCCQMIEHDIPLERMNLLPQLLDALPRKRWSELPGSRIALDMVADTARQWSDEARDKDVLALLEPWFVDDTRLDARHEWLFDLLLDAYTNLGKPRKKAALLDRALEQGDRPLRSAAQQRRATMLADAGDYARAWALFAQAQRGDPQSPSLSHLEITLLLNEGREAEARQRARFWALTLERRRDPGLADLIGFLHQVAAEGGAALLTVAADDDPAIAGFLELLRAAPPVAAHYALQASGGSAGELKPSRALKAALKLWDAAFLVADYSSIEDDDAENVWMAAPVWLPVLRAHPILWNAFEVLDALAHAVGEVPTLGVGGAVDTLLERGERVLREVIRANAADGLTLEWGWLENRPALTLLGGCIARDLEGAASAENLARLEWLVRTLNPNDNQGFRSALLRRYLELDRPADALAFADLYPDDFAAMRYSRALALFALDRVGLATFALRDAAQAHPKLLAWLLKANPKTPRADAFGVRVGGDYEAWLYRSECLGIWQRLGALDWARGVAKASRKA